MIESGLSINPDIHHFKVFSSVLLGTFWDKNKQKQYLLEVREQK